MEDNALLLKKIVLLLDTTIFMYEHYDLKANAPNCGAWINSVRDMRDRIQKK